MEKKSILDLFSKRKAQEDFSLDRLKMYTTAYDPSNEEFVKILNVRLDERGEPLIDTEWADKTKMLYRSQELTRYTI